MTAPVSRSQPIAEPVRQDDICLLVQKEMGWHNGADFDPDNCSCDQCEAERNEARKIVSMVAEMSHATLKARVEELERLWQAVEDNCWDVRCIDIPTGGGDADVGWLVIEHHMASPKEREIAQGRTPLEAVRAALNSGEPK